MGHPLQDFIIFVSKNLQQLLKDTITTGRLNGKILICFELLLIWIEHIFIVQNAIYVRTERNSLL